MERTEAACAGSASGSVVMLLMAVVVVGVPAADLGEACPDSGWLNHDGADNWLPSFSEEVTIPSEHVPSATVLTWADLRKEARKDDLELPQDGLPLPILTCRTRDVPCQHEKISNHSCMMVRQRALCVAVGGTCGSVMVTTREPMNCCCTRNNTINVSLLETCLITLEGTAGGPRREEREGGLGERRGGKEHILSSEGSAVPSLQREPPDTDHHEALDNTTSSERVESGGELTEEDVKKSSVLEDVIAALVFLFVGAVLVLIKSRVFRLTKKKQLQEMDVESQETLVDETII